MTTARGVMELWGVWCGRTYGMGGTETITAAVLPDRGRHWIADGDVSPHQ
ncbi:hypothetical protein [Streptomyces sp. NPDC001401]